MWTLHTFKYFTFVFIYKKQDKIIITFSFKMNDHVMNEEGAVWWASVGLMLHETRMWVGMLQANATVGTPDTYADVSVNMGPFCPSVLYYQPKVLEEARKVGGLVDQLVDDDGKKASPDAKKDDGGGIGGGDVLERMVTQMLDGNTREMLRTGTSFKRPKMKKKNKNENEIEKTPIQHQPAQPQPHDLLSLIRQSISQAPTNHDLFRLLRQNLRNLQSRPRPQTNLELLALDQAKCSQHPTARKR